jgi:hypothetical protein
LIHSRPRGVSELRRREQVGRWLTKKTGSISKSKKKKNKKKNAANKEEAEKVNGNHAASQAEDQEDEADEEEEQAVRIAAQPFLAVAAG